MNSLNAYVLLDDVLEKRAGIDAGNVPERLFAKRAAESGKPIHSEFESLEAQLRFSAALPDAVQAGLIKRALDDLDAGPPAMNARIAAWNADNLALETAYVEHNCNLFPEMCRAIGTEQNQNGSPESRKCSPSREPILFVPVSATSSAPTASWLSWKQRASG